MASRETRVFLGLGMAKSPFLLYRHWSNIQYLDGVFNRYNGCLETTLLAKLLKLGKIGGVTISAMLASANAGDPNEQELLVAARIGYYAGFTQANEHDGDKIAVIGEEQKRVARVALQIGAIHIRPVWPEEYNYKQPMSELQKRFSVAFNEGWINGVMAANLDIVDIGRSVNYRDREVSYYYRAERQLIENRSYPYYQRRVEYDTLNFDY